MRPSSENADLDSPPSRPTARHDGCRLLVADRLTQGGQAMTAASDSAAEERDAQGSHASPEGRILEMVAQGIALPHVLDGLCRLVEERTPGALASILLLDGDRLRHGGAPSLPKAYIAA